MPQLGGAGYTTITTEAGLTVPAKPFVVSVTVAVIRNIEDWLYVCPYEPPPEPALLLKPKEDDTVPSPKLNWMLTESLASAVQLIAAVTIWPICGVVGVALRLQMGGMGTGTIGIIESFPLPTTVFVGLVLCARTADAIKIRNPIIAIRPVRINLLLGDRFCPNDYPLGVRKYTP
jgi:hypothetical protein